MTHFRDTRFCSSPPKNVDSYGLSRPLTWLELNSNFVLPVVGSSYNVCLLSLISTELVGVFSVLAELKESFRELSRVCTQNFVHSSLAVSYVVWPPQSVSFHSASLYDC